MSEKEELGSKGWDFLKEAKEAKKKLGDKLFEDEGISKDKAQIMDLVSKGKKLKNELFIGK